LPARGHADYHQSSGISGKPRRDSLVTNKGPNAAAVIAAVVHAQPAAIAVHADRVTGDLRPIGNRFGYDEAGTTLTREGRHRHASSHFRTRWAAEDTDPSTAASSMPR
jgi:hypothetical protein